MNIRLRTEYFKVNKKFHIELVNFFSVSLTLRMSNFGSGNLQSFTDVNKKPFFLDFILKSVLMSVDTSYPKLSIISNSSLL